MSMQPSVSPFRSIGLLGLGLIGGSLAQAIKAKDPTVKLCSLKREDQDSKLALASGLIDQFVQTPLELVQHVEMLVIATPLSSILSLAEELAQCSSFLSHPVLIIDVGSVKGPIQERFETISHDRMEFLATHPMAGREKSGFSSSNKHLFEKATWAITPHQKNSTQNLFRLCKWIEFLEAHPFVLEAKLHDSQVALISHLPFILAKDFYDFVVKTDPNSLSLAGPGFHSFTRLAHDNVELHNEIFQMNRNLIEKFLHEWLKQFSDKW